MHTIFLIVGESGSGKDTLVSMMCSNYKCKQVLSYTTRPMRVGEGVTHRFIDPNEVEQYKDEIVAYTKIGEYEYFATKSQLKEADFYIIDYEGVKYMKNLNLDMSDIRFVTIFIHTPRHIREQRVLQTRKDNITTFYKRCFNEDIQFKEMLIKGDFDYSITNVDLNKSYAIFRHIVETETEADNETV